MPSLVWGRLWARRPVSPPPHTSPSSMRLCASLPRDSERAFLPSGISKNVLALFRIAPKLSLQVSRFFAFCQCTLNITRQSDHFISVEARLIDINSWDSRRFDWCSVQPHLSTCRNSYRTVQSVCIPRISHLHLKAFGTWLLPRMVAATNSVFYYNLALVAQIGRMHFREDVYRARMKGGSQVSWIWFLFAEMPGLDCSIHATWGPPFSLTLYSKEYSCNVVDRVSKVIKA